MTDEDIIAQLTWALRGIMLDAQSKLQVDKPSILARLWRKVRQYL